MRQRIESEVSHANPPGFEGRRSIAGASRENGGRKPRRSIDIMASMLAVCNGGARKTEIMYKANLSHDMLERYLKTLSAAKLIEKFDMPGVYRATAKGLAFLKDYGDFKKTAELYDAKRSSLLRHLEV